MSEDFQQSCDDSLDATGLLCPEPLMLVRNRLRDMQPGALLYVRATDPSTERDFDNLCRFVGHEMVNKKVESDVLEFLLRRKAE
ncbi:MAG: sulfurtransferase TusA [Pseudomonadaceae bacterium]|nr:sulfurtransferase TusA [Pseudomonadaceae bacterium]